MPRAGKPRFPIEAVHLVGCGLGELLLTAAELRSLQEYLGALGLTEVELEPCAEESEGQPILAARMPEHALISADAGTKRASQGSEVMNVSELPRPKRVRAARDASPASDASLTPTSRSSTPEREPKNDIAPRAVSMSEKEEGVYENRGIFK